MSDEIERLRAHVEKHHLKDSAYFSIKGLTVLLTMLDALKEQNERLIAKEGKRISEALSGRKK
jgi:hypothetical protein